MGIETSELKIYAPATVNDTTANGGHMSATEITSGASGNLFPYVSLSERTAGSTKYRKLFFKVADSENTEFANVKISMSSQTPADDYVVWFPTTQSSTQNGITGSEDYYGCGNLNANVSAGASSLDVYVEEPTTLIFRDDCTIRISNKATPSSPTGTTEYHVVDTVSWVGNVATLTLVTTLANAYSSGAKVSTVYEVASIDGTYGSFSKSSTLGTYNDTSYPILVSSIGGISESWTITFTSATAFTCSGARVGVVGTGNRSSNFSPTNTSFSTPYFTLYSGGFGGTWATNDTITFTTTPAAYPIWCKRVVPTGAASYSGNNFKMVIDGESA